MGVVGSRELAVGSWEANFFKASLVQAPVTKKVWVTAAGGPAEGPSFRTGLAWRRMPAKTPNALLHGTLDALILKTLAGGPRHGYAIAKFIEDASDETVIVEEGSLYPALYRMERRGWLEAEWGESELGRRDKLYRLTRQGRAQLEAETAAWRQFAAGVSRILLAQ